MACMAEGRGVYKVSVGKPDGKSHLGDQDADGRIILRWSFKKWEGVVRTGWSWLSIGTSLRLGFVVVFGEILTKSSQ